MDTTTTTAPADTACANCGETPRDVDPPLDDDGLCVECTEAPCCSRHSGPNDCDDYEMDR